MIHLHRSKALSSETQDTRSISIIGIPYSDNGKLVAAIEHNYSTATAITQNITQPKYANPQCRQHVVENLQYNVHHVSKHSLHTINHIRNSSTQTLVSLHINHLIIEWSDADMPVQRTIRCQHTPQLRLPTFQNPAASSSSTLNPSL